jgi:hypothetical protein
VPERRGSGLGGWNRGRSGAGARCPLNDALPPLSGASTDARSAKSDASQVRGARSGTENPRVAGITGVEQRRFAPLTRQGGGSRPISRVLSRTVIHLGRASPHASCDLPGSTRGPRAATRTSQAPLFGLAPDGVYRAAECCHRRGALLPHLFTLTARPCVGARSGVGGLFSVALSVGLHPPGVTWHPALWSPDFPPPGSA